MYVNVPTADQRTERGADGRPPEDGNMDCVAESLAKMAQATTGRFLTGDGLHDAVYGQGYIGMQDPARYVGYLAGLGLTLTPYSGAPADLVAHAAACIRAGHPVLLSIPSDWNDNPPTSGYAHMVAGCDVDSSAGPGLNQTTLTAMNPWGGFYQTQSLAWWQERLATCAYKATWVMTKTGEGTSMAGVPAGWHDNGAVLTAPNNVSTEGYIRAHILGEDWPAELVPVAPLYGVTGGWRQDFYGGSRSIEATTGAVTSEQAGPDYPAQVAALTAQLAAANAEIAHLKANPPVPVPVPPVDPTAAPLRAALAAFLAEKG